MTLVRRPLALLPALALFAAATAAPAAPDPDEKFERAAKRNHVPGMVEAAAEIAAAPSEDGAEVLAKYGGLIEDVEVYVAARDALAACVEAGDDAREEVVKGLTRGRRMEQKALCADALGRAGVVDEEILEALTEALEEREVSVRIAAIRALRAIRAPEVVAPLFTRLGELDMEGADAEVEELYDALLELTGQSFTVIEDWEKWWETAGPDFDPTAVQRAETGGEAGTRQRASSGRIFDSEVRSSRFVLCLDISSSMRVIDLPPGDTWTDPDGNQRHYRDPGMGWPPDPQSRFVRARTEFVEFVRALDPHVRFTIVVFGAQPDTKVWEDQLVVASGRNKGKAIQFVEGLQWSGATRTDLALERCFEVQEADTIYLFSDGIPQRKGAGGELEAIPQDEVLEKARTLNRARKVRLNVYGFATVSGAAKAFMRRLAEQNEGEYKDIR